MALETLVAEQLSLLGQLLGELPTAGLRVAWAVEVRTAATKAVRMVNLMIDGALVVNRIGMRSCFQERMAC